MRNYKTLIAIFTLFIMIILGCYMEAPNPRTTSAKDTDKEIWYADATVDSLELNEVPLPNTIYEDTLISIDTITLDTIDTDISSVISETEIVSINTYSLTPEIISVHNEVILTDVELKALKEEKKAKEEAKKKKEEQEKRSKKIFESESLSAELQWYAYDVCKKNGVPFEIFMSLMRKESGYKANAIGSGRDYGLCQIRDNNHARLTKALGITNFLNPYENIKGGVYILKEALAYYPNNIHCGLMSYNGGPGYAKKLISRGIYSSKYSREIVAYATKLGYK